MCGFFGEYNFASGPITEKKIFQEINGLSKERGPDNEGYYTDGSNIQLGFNRLAILDLSPKANQPMSSPSGRYIFVFNGEIYNHNDLRRQLSYNKFTGNSDTETIAAAIDEWGIKRTVSALDGMFAIGIYDSKEKLLFLVRDFAGVKPFFYGRNKGKIVFASQYDQVVKHPAFTGEGVDEEVLNLYLQQHYMPAPFGIINKTFQVNPGEMIIVNSEGQLKKETYWQFPTDIEPEYTSKNEALDYLEGMLQEAVKSEMLSDVPVGTFLSGGIDSPLITYYASENTSDKIKSFTIGSDSKLHDESIFATRYGKMIGVDHHIEMMNSGSANHIVHEVIGALHEPIADFSIIPTYLVSRLASKKVKVALSGDGGDELFFGYERFWSIAKNRKIQDLPYLYKYLIYGTDKVLFKSKHFNSGLLLAEQGKAHMGLHTRFPKKELVDICGSSSGGLPEAYRTYDYKNSSSLDNLLNNMRRAEYYGMMQKTLRKVDLASMGNSLEVRVPFLKKSFIEASFKVDPKLSIDAKLKKQLLKDLLKRKLPDSPIDDVKRGFTIPLDRWIRQDLRETFGDTLGNKNMHHEFGFNPDAVDKMLKDHLDNKQDHKWPLFTLFSLYKWRESLLK
jgi:asparagine synthase (glutamine-hydrolysing)